MIVNFMDVKEQKKIQAIYAKVAKLNESLIGVPNIFSTILVQNVRYPDETEGCGIIYIITDKTELTDDTYTFKFYSFDKDTKHKEDMKQLELSIESIIKDKG